MQIDNVINLTDHRRKHTKDKIRSALEALGVMNQTGDLAGFMFIAISGDDDQKHVIGTFNESGKATLDMIGLVEILKQSLTLGSPLASHTETGA